MTFIGIINITFLLHYFAFFILRLFCKKKHQADDVKSNIMRHHTEFNNWTPSEWTGLTLYFDRDSFSMAFYIAIYGVYREFHGKHQTFIGNSVK